MTISITFHYASSLQIIVPMVYSNIMNKKYICNNLYQHSYRYNQLCSQLLVSTESDIGTPLMYKDISIHIHMQRHYLLSQSITYLPYNNKFARQLNLNLYFILMGCQSISCTIKNLQDTHSVQQISELFMFNSQLATKKPLIFENCINMSQ